MVEKAHVVVIGAGIVGLAAAFQMLRARPGLELVVLEKEDGPARHQSGRNSGVLHSGVYYRPGSLKARNCRSGRKMMEEFCREHAIALEICGKVIVATTAAETAALAELQRRGAANGAGCRLIDARELERREPHVQGVAALHVAEAGIVDYRLVCDRLAGLLAARGARLVFGARVGAVRPAGTATTLETTRGAFQARTVVSCAGLHADRLAGLFCPALDARVVPFRGHFYRLKAEARHLCRALVYPVPDPRFPFLGAHFTRRPDGDVECGPNAVLALAREGYRGGVALHDLAATLRWPGFWRLARRHWRRGAAELWRSWSKASFARALRRLIPELRARQLEPAPCGIRAQIVRRDGELVDDFWIEDHERGVLLVNAPSPAATAAFAIGEHCARRALARLDE